MNPWLATIVLVLFCSIVSCSEPCPCLSLKDVSVSCPYKLPDGHLSKPRQFVTAYNLYISQGKNDTDKAERAEIWRKSNKQCRERAQLALNLKVLRQRFLHYKPPTLTPLYSTKGNYFLYKYKIV